MDPDAPSAVKYRTATAEDIDKLREFEQQIVAAERDALRFRRIIANADQLIWP